MVSIDECGFNENLRPIYGYSKIGERLLASVKGGWNHYSLFLAIFETGEKRFLIKPGYIKRRDLTDFLENIGLDSRHCVLLDNASIHKSLKLNGAATSAKMLYTPPYSPEFNPIELSFATIKSDFRSSHLMHAAIQDRIERSVGWYPQCQLESCFRHVRERFVEGFDLNAFKLRTREFEMVKMIPRQIPRVSEEVRVVKTTRKREE